MLAEFPQHSHAMDSDIVAVPSEDRELHTPNNLYSCCPSLVVLCKYSFKTNVLVPSGTLTRLINISKSQLPDLQYIRM